MSTAALPPGPAAPAAIQALRLSRDPLGTLDAARRRHGDVFTLRLWRVGHVVVVADLEAIALLVDGDPAVAHAGAARRRLLPILPSASALGSDGVHHRTARARLLNVLDAPALEPLSARMIGVAAEHVDRWPAGRPFALLPRVRRLALDVVVREVLAVRDRRRACALVDAVLRMLWSPVIAPGLWVPDPSGGPAVRAGWSLFGLLRRRVDRLVRQELARRRSPSGGGEKDVLAALLAGPAQLDDDGILDEVLGLLVAATEPIGAGLTWALDRLARHPAAADAIRTAPDNAMARAAILETLHTRPAIIDAARELTRPVTVAGHHLPAGTAVMVAIPLLQEARPPAGEAPFAPRRWLEGDAPHPSLPFGGGQRTCLGAALTFVLGNAVVQAALARCVLAPAGRPERVALRGTALVPHRGGRVVAKRRR